MPQTSHVVAASASLRAPSKTVSFVRGILALDREEASRIGESGTSLLADGVSSGAR
ncbi:hypothetical protein [Luethyella okanaganae]|uniref:Uncharacterized protein n=1 Tax=Luethyella okanaganae TaxID=69372 RepID=A0ABW1VHP5_9MICO